MVRQYPTNGAPTFEALSEAPYPKAPAGVAPESVVSPRYSPPTNQGTIYPTLSGASDQYYPVQNQYQQNQVPPPQTVYVVQNNADTSTTDVCCIALDCCICCDAFLDCFKICFGDIDNDSSCRFAKASLNVIRYTYSSGGMEKAWRAVQTCHDHVNILRNFPVRDVSCDKPPGTTSTSLEDLHTKRHGDKLLVTESNFNEKSNHDKFAYMPYILHFSL
nr:uncharacterized protein LOC124211826 [Neodiprion pinetum]XP_046467242.1 uncharacterized protein LOC124211826 [Neodiprion pinetum]XP_046467243.1 uncharacterized protein LOC124211826 [Neodiprion pinetum]